MDLHEVFSALTALGGKDVELTVGVDWGLSPDRTVHHCMRCGYQTELLEVMAIHAVNAHKFPFGRGDYYLEDPSRRGGTVPGMVVTMLPGGRGLPAQCFVQGVEDIEYWEADQPSGPWSRCPDWVIRKRYGNFRAKPRS
jgi:hypothetical protein